MTKLQVFLLTFAAALSGAANADVLLCIDNAADLANKGFTYSGNPPMSCDSAACIPEVLDPPIDGKEHRGFVVFNGSASISWNRPSFNNKYEYVYMRYRARKQDTSSPAVFDIKGDFPAGAGTAPLPPSYASDLRWKETCFRINPNSRNLRQIVVNTFTSDEYLVIDKIIVLTRDFVSGCATSPFPVNLCNGQFFTTSPTTDGTSPLTEPTSPTTEPTTSATQVSSPTSDPGTTPLPDPSEPLIEWVDLNTDLSKYAWSTSTGLQYANSTYDLPPMDEILPAASGLFYFQGKPEGDFVQEISRTRSSNGSKKEAHIHIRYYVHHTNPANDQHYYVSPVQGRFQGVQYLDTTPDFKWKEVFLHLDDFQTEVSFQIGTTDAIEDQDMLIIDKIIFMERPS